MMNIAKSRLQAICGLKIVDAVLTIGDAGMSFENGISLAIYNNFRFSGAIGAGAKTLVGKSVIGVDEEDYMVTIQFENDLALQIDMRDEAYTGPEAMQLRVPGEPIVIWG